MKGSIIQKRKYQKYLIIIFVVLIAAIGIVFYKDYLLSFIDLKTETSLPPEYFPEIKIDFEVLESSSLKRLDPFPELPSYPEEGNIGKDNPFSKESLFSNWEDIIDIETGTSTDTSTDINVD